MKKQFDIKSSKDWFQMPYWEEIKYIKFTCIYFKYSSLLDYENLVYNNSLQMIVLVKEWRYMIIKFELWWKCLIAVEKIQSSW
jgi:hypothetical protein